MDTVTKELLKLNDPIQDMKELNRVIIRAARRCAYDLGHAAGEIKDPDTQKIFWDRHYMWLNVFNPVNGGKDYRDELHRRISFLEHRVDAFIKLCENSKVDYSEITINDLPF